MIGVDWGTSSFRAFQIGPDGAVTDRIASAQGILQVAPGAFADTLRAALAPWLTGNGTKIIMSGMVGSRQGWQEAPYLPCPAGAADLAAGLVPVAFDGGIVRLVPGLLGEDAAGVPEVMRGEETQIIGLLDRLRGDGLACMPGSHCKWVRIADGCIAGFTTQMTGEAFAALRGHTILGRMMADAPHDADGFAAGVARARQPGGLLHHLFGVRTLGLTGRLADTAAASYLSGLLIGHEVAAALPPDSADVLLVGEPALCAYYATAIAAAGRSPMLGDPDAAARGLAILGGMASWN